MDGIPHCKITKSKGRPLSPNEEPQSGDQIRTLLPGSRHTER